MNHELLERQPIPGYLERYVSLLVAAVSLDVQHPRKLRHLCQNALTLHERSARYGLVQSHGKPEQSVIAELEQAKTDLSEAKIEIRYLLNHAKIRTELELDENNVARTIELLGESDRRLIRLCSAVEVFLEELLCSLDDECESAIRDAVVESKLHLLAKSGLIEIQENLLPREKKKKNEPTRTKEDDPGAPAEASDL